MDRRLTWFFVLLVPAFVWSWINPHDRFTWWLEVAPALIGLPLIWAVRRRFPLSTLLLALIYLHIVILLVGGHYTYALVPLGEWAKGWFGWQREQLRQARAFRAGLCAGDSGAGIVRSAPHRSAAAAGWVSSSSACASRFRRSTN
jgi:putative membrane protein